MHKYCWMFNYFYAYDYACHYLNTLESLLLIYSGVARNKGKFVAMGGGGGLHGWGGFGGPDPQ